MGARRGSFSVPRFRFGLLQTFTLGLKTTERDDLRKLRESDPNPFEESVQRLGAEHARRQRVQAAALQLLNDQAGVTPANEYVKLRAANDEARLDFNLAQMELDNHFRARLEALQHPAFLNRQAAAEMVTFTS